MKDSQRYYKDIKKVFPINGKKEKNYLKNIKEQIGEYENISYSDLENEFGTPIEVAKSYYDTIDSHYLIKKINVKRYVNLISITVLILITLYLGYRAYVLNRAYNDFKTGIPTDIEEIIMEE